MSSKKGGKKGGRKSASAAGERYVHTHSPDGEFKSGEKAKLDETMIEVYEAKVRDLSDKLERYKNKCQTLVAENDALGKAQAKASHDKQDIVEFLNIKVGEHEKQINTMEEKAVQMDQEKADMIKQAQGNLDTAMAKAHKEIDSLQNQCSIYKAQLSDLHTFAARKDELEQQLQYLKGQLEEKERTFKDTVHNIERKVLQDKNLLKREMLQKVNEAVANFQRTTKRAIRENMVITSQLKKMSSKTMELIAENDSLKEKVNRLRTHNSLLVESELELAKKNQTYQRVIKTLVTNLKESDKMLEVAYDGTTVDENGVIIRHENSHGVKDGKDFYYVFSSGAATPQESDGGDDNRKHAAIVPNIVEACNTFDEMAEFWEANLEGSNDPVTLSMSEFIDRLHATLMEIAEFMRDEDKPTESGPAPDKEKTPTPEPTEDSPNAPTKETHALQQEPKRVRAPLKHLHPYMAPMKRRVADLKPVIAVLPGGPNRRPLSRADGTTEEKPYHEVAIQTMPLPFAPTTKAEYLLGEVRQWGAPAQSLPQKGLSYVARRYMTQPQALIASETPKQQGPPLRL
ncbi:hypothetical protein HDU86_002397 [Geranomyces michiganensis]|nr:hypothetical protein HDU86_002397 [Geranomyces michiganensis]